MRFILFLSLLCSQLAFASADYARERNGRMKSPRIVVGDAIYLEAKA